MASALVEEHDDPPKFWEQTMFGGWGRDPSALRHSAGQGGIVWHMSRCHRVGCLSSTGAGCRRSEPPESAWWSFCICYRSTFDTAPLQLRLCSRRRRFLRQDTGSLPGCQLLPLHLLRSSLAALLCYRYAFLQVPMPKVLASHSHHLQELALHSPGNPANVGRLFSIIEPISMVSATCWLLAPLVF